MQKIKVNKKKNLKNALVGDPGVTGEKLFLFKLLFNFSNYIFLNFTNIFLIKIFASSYVSILKINFS